MQFLAATQSPDAPQTNSAASLIDGTAARCSLHPHWLMARVVKPRLYGSSFLTLCGEKINRASVFERTAVRLWDCACSQTGSPDALLSLKLYNRLAPLKKGAFYVKQTS